MSFPILSRKLPRPARSLLPSRRANDFALVPNGSCSFGGRDSAILFPVLKVRGLSTTIDAHHVPAPAILLFKKSGSAAARTFKQFYSLMNIYHNSSSDFDKRAAFATLLLVLLVTPFGSSIVRTSIGGACLRRSMVSSLRQRRMNRGNHYSAGA